ncbi:MAG: TolB family protein [Gemmatimonadota bacterium]
MDGRHGLVAALFLTLTACAGEGGEEAVPAGEPMTWDVVFVSQRDDEGDIYRWAPGDSLPHLLFGGEGAQYGPRWDWARRRLTYLMKEEGGVGIFSAEDRGFRRIGANPSETEPVAWSRDGAWIAYSTHKGQTFNIFVEPADQAGQPTLITDDGGNDTQPEWAPDRSAVSFTSDRAGSEDIWIIPTDGEPMVNLTPTENRAEGHASWSPDAREMVFFGEGDGGTGTDLFIVDVATRERRSLLAGEANERDPSWSPDGRWIAFVSDAGGDWNVWVMRPDGTGLTQVSHAPGEDGDARWVPAPWKASTELQGG